MPLRLIPRALWRQLPNFDEMRCAPICHDSDPPAIVLAQTLALMIDNCHENQRLGFAGSRPLPTALLRSAYEIMPHGIVADPEAAGEAGQAAEGRSGWA